MHGSATRLRAKVTTYGVVPADSDGMHIRERTQTTIDQYLRNAADLRRLVRGRVAGPSDPDWDAERYGWNLAIDQHPAAVVHVADEADVVAAVRYAKERGLAVTAQPTGHGVSDALDGAIVLRTGSLHNIDVDTVRRRVTVGAGVRWQELNDVLGDTGLTGLPGSSGDVGVVGYTVGGGLSWFGRRYGLACEWLVAVDIVDAAGNPRHVTAESEPDLFWALRGGGGDFGIVTGIELALLDRPGVYGGRLTWPAEYAPQVLTAYAEFTAEMPDELSMWAWLLELPHVEGIPDGIRGVPTVAIDVVYLGDAATCERLLAPMRSELPGPTADSLGPVPLSRLGDIAAEPVDPMPLLDHTTLLHRFDAEVVRTLLEARPTDEPSALNVLEIRRLGGALDRSDSGGAAGPVGQPYMMMTGGVAAGDLEPLRTAMDRVQNAMSPYDSGRKPYNFSVDAELVYPPGVLDRLREVKRRYDPDGVIRCNRPVLPPDDT